MVDPVLTVVVCTYNRAHLLKGCLDALVDQFLSPDAYEVLVVDNNSTDATLDIAKDYASRYAHFRALTEARQGLSIARNSGWSHARGLYVAYIDDDALAPHDWCARIIENFERVSPQPSAMGGPAIPFYDQALPAWVAPDFGLRTWGDQAGFLPVPGYVHSFYGMNMMFRRDVLVASGGFAESMGLSGVRLIMGEEPELFSRLQRVDPQFWYDPQLAVRHYEPVDKMTPCYLLRRRYATGEADRNIARIKRGSLQLAYRVLDLVALIVLTLPRAASHVLWERWRWQRSLLHEGLKVAAGAGFVFGRNIQLPPLPAENGRETSETMASGGKHK